ncbi:MAG: hypothetical protein HYU54_11175 [Actinobacteria bacterium]|nr:hypothetical protein [Actinomycetota bacterium]
MLSSLAQPRVSPRAHASLTGLALAAWSFAMISRSDPNADANTFFLVFVVAMLTSVFGLTFLASANLHIAETIVRLLGKAFAGLRAILRPPLAYLSRRPIRTGLTTRVFGHVKKATFCDTEKDHPEGYSPDESAGQRHRFVLRFSG